MLSLSSLSNSPWNRPAHVHMSGRTNARGVNATPHGRAAEAGCLSPMGTLIVISVRRGDPVVVLIGDHIRLEIILPRDSSGILVTAGLIAVANTHRSLTANLVITMGSITNPLMVTVRATMLVFAAASRGTGRGNAQTSRSMSWSGLWPGH